MPQRGKRRKKGDPRPESGAAITRRPDQYSPLTGTGADHLKMTGRAGLERLTHLEGVLRDRQKEAQRTGDPMIAADAFDIARDVRNLRRSYSRQIKKQSKME